MNARTEYNDLLMLFNILPRWLNPTRFRTFSCVCVRYLSLAEMIILKIFFSSFRKKKKKKNVSSFATSHEH